MSSHASDTTDRAAHRAESHPAFRALARGGYAANGVIHILIGATVLAVGGLGGRESSQSGAFQAIASAPLGMLALWVIALGLLALGLWYIAEGFLASAPDTGKRWAHRLKEWAKAIVYIVLGVSAASVALGSGGGGDSSIDSASATVLSLPGGRILLGLVGVGVGVVGVVFIVKGAARKFREKLRMPGGTMGRTVTVAGVIGYIAKGLSLVVIGILVLVAAVQADPSEAGGLDQAMSALLQLPFGPWLVTAVGLGLIAYGIYCFFRARYARL